MTTCSVASAIGNAKLWGANDLEEESLKEFVVPCWLDQVRSRFLRICADAIRSVHRASGSGRSWIVTAFGRFALPPSRWYIVRVS